MLMRLALVCACVVGASSAVAEELGSEQAHAFLLGKPFDFACSDGTAGSGRILSDGSVVGTIRIGEQGQPHSGQLPPGTIRVDGTSMCAHLTGVPITPCFKVRKIGSSSFRGSITGLGLGSCELYQHNPRSRLIAAGSNLSP